MVRDFTLNQYLALILALQESGYKMMTVARYLGDQPAEAHAVVLRHDVDRFPERALRMAHLEHSTGICSTYYFRTNPSVFRPSILCSISQMGHEVGYHYETLSKCKGDYPAAIELFQKELASLRQVCPIQTISMHGNPLSPFDNRDLWKRFNFTQYGLIGEAYLSIDYQNLPYLTDAGRSWADNLSNLRDRVANEETPSGIRTTADLIAAVRKNRFTQMCISAHPERWAANMSELLGSASLDLVANSIKIVLRRFIFRGFPGAGRGRAL